MPTALMKYLPILARLFLYALSLASPAFSFVKTFPPYNSSTGSPNIEVMDGLTVLLIGWLGCLIWQFGWLANPIYYLSLYCLWAEHWKVIIATNGLAIVVLEHSNRLVLALFHQTETLPQDTSWLSLCRQHLRPRLFDQLLSTRV